jgi:hypothetical protein
MIFDFLEWCRRLFCKHPESYWVRNLYGDEINQWSGNRSLWRCKKCGALSAKPELMSGDKE